MAKYTQVIKRDLSQARTNEKLPVISQGWVIDTIDGAATLRVGSKKSYPYNLQNFDSVKLPGQINKFFLSNPATSGKLIIHFLKEGGLDPLMTTGSTNLAIAEKIERKLDETIDQEIMLDCSAFGRQYVEVIAATFNTDRSDSGTATDFTLYISPDKEMWYKSQSSSGVTLWQNGWFNAMRYLKLTSSAAGTTGQTVDLIITATKG